MDLVFFHTCQGTPVGGHLSGEIFGLRKFLTKKKIFGLLDLVFFTPVRGHLSGDIFGLKKFLKKKKIFQLKKNFDENFFGLGQFLKKKFFLEFKILISILHLSNVTAIIGRQHG